MEINYEIHTFKEGCHNFSIGEYSIWIILQGKAEITSDNYQKTLRYYDVLELPLQKNVQLSPSKDGIVIGMAYLNDMSIVNTSFRHFSFPDTEFISKTFKYAIDAMNFQGPRMTVIRNHVNQLFFEALMCLGYSYESTPPHIRHVIDAVVQNASNPAFQLSEAIEETGYSASHFRKVFRNLVGTSPLEFLNQIRLDKAKEYIRQKNGIVSVKDVSAHCGFTDPYYFSRLFRKKEGISPSEYAYRIKEE